MSPWDVLGLEEGAEARVIRRAYAQKLREVHPEDHPEHFKQIRAAYEALTEGRWQHFTPIVDDEGGEDEAPGSVTTEPAPPDKTDTPAEIGPWGVASDAPSERQQVAMMLDRLDRHLNQYGHSGREECVAMLNAIIEHQSIEDIDHRSTVEHRLAEIILVHLPASDVLILPSVSAFQWGDKVGEDYAINAVMDRLKEWKLIHQMEKGSHNLSGGWACLTGKSPRWMRLFHSRAWRRDQVADLLDYADYWLPGLAFSMKAEAVEWWREELTRSRIRLGAIAVRLLTMVATFLLLLIWGLSGVAAAIAGVGLGLFLFADQAAQQAVLQRLNPLEGDGWPVAMLTLVALSMPLIAACLQPDWIAASGIALATIAIVWSLRILTVSESGVSPDRFYVTLGGLSGYALVVLGNDEIGLPRLIMVVSLAWLLTVSLGKLRPTLGKALDRLLGGVGGWVIMALMAAGILVAWQASILGLDQDFTRLCIVLMIFAAGGIAAFTQCPVPPQILALCLVGANLMLVGTVTRDAKEAYLPATPGELFVDAHDHPGTPVQDPSFDVEQVKYAMKIGNPDLYADIEKALADLDAGAGHSVTIDQIDTLVYAEANRRLPSASNSLIVENLVARHAIIEILIRRQPSQCATNRIDVGSILPTAVRRQHMRALLQLVYALPATAEERKDVSLPDPKYLEERMQELRADLAPAFELDGPENANRRACFEKLLSYQILLEQSPDQTATLYRASAAAHAE